VADEVPLDFVDVSLDFVDIPLDFVDVPEVEPPCSPPTLDELVTGVLAFELVVGVFSATVLP